MKTNVIHTGDSAEVLKSFDADCIDLTVTSPPYDNLRTYNGFTFDFEAIAQQHPQAGQAQEVALVIC
jgi:DNA modification methylase